MAKCRILSVAWSLYLVASFYSMISIDSVATILEKARHFNDMGGVSVEQYNMAILVVKDYLQKGLERQPTDSELAVATNMNVSQPRKQIGPGQADRNKLIKHKLRLMLFVMKKYFQESTAMIKKVDWPGSQAFYELNQNDITSNSAPSDQFPSNSETLLLEINPSNITELDNISA
ncbi:hypothetical protein Tco_0959256 [Tanacetum coccineum]